MANNSEVAANQIMILGGGVNLEAAQLTIWSEQRAERAVAYYHEERNRFLGHGAIIVCTGGYAGLAGGMAAPSAELREARLMADYLVQADVPSHLIEEEPASTSTLTNLLNTVELGLIRPKEIAADNPLGVVTHPHHAKRFMLFAGKIGIETDHVQPIVTKQQDNASREFVFRAGYRAFMFGAGSDHDKLRAREQALEHTLGMTRVGIRKTLSKLPS